MMNRPRWLIVGATLCALVAAASFIVPKEGQLTAGSVPPTAAPARLPALRLPVLVNGWGNDALVEVPSARKQELLVLVFFTLHDCVTAQGDLRYWSALGSEMAGRARVVGVAVGEDFEMVRYYLEANRFTLPVAHDADGTLRAFLTGAELLTPVAVVATTTGEILHVERPLNGSPDRQQAMRDQLGRLTAAAAE
jgi:hypothetical protein